MFDAAHPAGLIAGGAHPSPVGIADVVTLTTHKTLRGPRGRRHPVRGRAGEEDRQRRVPGPAGRSARARHRGQGDRLRRGGPARVPPVRAQVVANAGAFADALAAHGFRLVSGGTDNHMLLVDLRPFDAELTGKEAQEVLDRAGITCNRNTIPDDPRSPFLTSGLRLGTAAETTAGMGPPEMQPVADLIVRTLKARTDDGRDRRRARRRSPRCAPPSPVSRPRGIGHARHRLVRPDPGDRRRRHRGTDRPGQADLAARGLRGLPECALGARQAHRLRRRGGHVHRVLRRGAGRGRRARAAAALPGLAGDVGGGPGGRGDVRASG